MSKSLATASPFSRPLSPVSSSASQSVRAEGALLLAMQDATARAYLSGDFEALANAAADLTVASAQVYSVAKSLAESLDQQTQAKPRSSRRLLRKESARGR